MRFFFVLFFLSLQVHAGYLLLDLEGIGAPDLLGGADAWAVNRSPSSVSFFNHRAVRLERDIRLWEWVGPKAGLLLVTKDGRVPEGVIDGEQIVGNTMGNRQWRDCYLALSYFDKDKDQRITGPELARLYVWVDANLDGLADRGEVVPSATLLNSISTYPAFLDGARWAEAGASLKDGKQIGTWEWSPRALPQLVDSGQKPIPPLSPVYVSPEDALKMPPPVVYFWTHSETGNSGLYRFFKVGNSLWVATLGPNYEDFPVVSVGEVFIEGDEEKRVSWAVTDGGSRWCRVDADLAKDGRIKGKATYGAKSIGLESFQVLPPFRVRREVLSFLSLPDSVFQEAILGQLPSQVLVPSGFSFSGFSGTRGLLDL